MTLLLSLSLGFRRRRQNFPFFFLLLFLALFFFSSLNLTFFVGSVNVDNDYSIYFLSFFFFVGPFRLRRRSND